MRYCQYLGKFTKPIDNDQVQGLALLEKDIDEFLPFHRLVNKGFTQVDTDFVRKMMVFDYRIRPAVDELLQDNWWGVDAEEVGTAVSGYVCGMLDFHRTYRTARCTASGLSASNSVHSIMPDYPTLRNDDVHGCVCRT
ncbi:hypothetical protein PMIN06_001982 [Paraphaeosphaeria minitans]